MTNSDHPEGSGNQSGVPTNKWGSDKAFGLVFGVVFILIGVYPLVNGALIRLWAMALACLFVVVALIRPALLAPLNRLWTRFGLAIHKVMSPIALLTVFGIAVLPTGLLMRALGKDLLRLRFEPEADTYWIDRQPPGRADQQMKKQF